MTFLVIHPLLVRMRTFSVLVFFSFGFLFHLSSAVFLSSIFVHVFIFSFTRNSSGLILLSCSRRHLFLVSLPSTSSSSPRFLFSPFRGSPSGSFLLLFLSLSSMFSSPLLFLPPTCVWGIVLLGFGVFVISP